MDEVARALVGINPWLAVLYTLIIPAASAGWIVWQTQKKAAEAAAKTETPEERRLRERHEREDAIQRREDETREWVLGDAERNRKRVIELETQLDEVNQALDAERDNCRAWNDRAHHLKHQLDNMQLVLDRRMMERGEPEREWPDETLPPIDQIVENNALRRAKRGWGC